MKSTLLDGVMKLVDFQFELCLRENKMDKVKRSGKFQYEFHKLDQ